MNLELEVFWSSRRIRIVGQLCRMSCFIKGASCASHVDSTAGGREWVAYNGFRLSSYEYPEIAYDTNCIFLRGEDRELDNDSAIAPSSWGDTTFRRYVDKLTVAVNEYNGGVGGVIMR